MKNFLEVYFEIPNGMLIFLILQTLRRNNQLLAWLLNVQILVIGTLNLTF